MVSATTKIAPAGTAPKQLAIACEDQCSLHPKVIGQEMADALKALVERGAGRPTFIREGSALLGRPISNGAAQRHLGKHYRELDTTSELDMGTRRASDVEILDEVIQSAWKNRRNWKPTLRDMLEAMAKKHSITGGSEVGDLMALFDAPEPEMEEIEAPEVVLSPEERPNDDSEDLEGA